MNSRNPNRFFISQEKESGNWSVFGRNAIRPNIPGKPNPAGSGSIFCVSSEIPSETVAIELCRQYETGQFSQAAVAALLPAGTQQDDIRGEELIAHWRRHDGANHARKEAREAALERHRERVARGDLSTEQLHQDYAEADAFYHRVINGE